MKADHYVVAPGDELAVVNALVGEVFHLEPICPLCGHQGASRIWNMEDGPQQAVPCYLGWCAAHGVHAPIRDGEHLPRGGEEWGRNIRCDGCRYNSPPSAFCKPAGPPYRRSA